MASGRRTAKPIIYLPFTEDTFDPLFVSGGKEYLLSTARKAIEDLRLANVPASAFPGELLADVVPAEVITTLAVIEQTDDARLRGRADGLQRGAEPVRPEAGARRIGTVSRSAAAIGPMQFTNRKGNGTYAMVVRRCPRRRIDPNFERGATDLLNAMKAAICLFDIELAQMRPEIRDAYRDNMKVLGIFPVAAYNGGPRNVTRLYGVMKKVGVKLEDLRPPGEQPPGKQVKCPCLWKEAETRSVPWRFRDTTTRIAGTSRSTRASCESSSKRQDQGTFTLVIENGIGGAPPLTKVNVPLVSH